MKKWGFGLCLAVAGALLCVWGWHLWFPSPEQVIRRRLNELAHLASFAPNEGPLAKVLNPDKISGFFTPDVLVKFETSGFVQTFSGRERVRELAVVARSTLASFRLEFPDINVAVGPNQQSAEVDLTARGRVPGDRDVQVYELKFTMQKLGGDWLVRRVETVKTLL